MHDKNMRVSAYWRSREQTLQSLADSFKRQVEVLRSFRPAFAHWFCIDPVPGLTAADQEYFDDKPFEELRGGDLVKLMIDYTRVINRDAEEPSGRSFYLTVSTNDSLKGATEDVLLSLKGSYQSRLSPLPCEIMFVVNNLNEPPPDLRSHAFFQRILGSFIEIWRPDLVSVGPPILSNLLGFPNPPFRGAWIVALPSHLADMTTLPTTTYNERRPNGWLVMSATKEPFDIDNPEHIACARAIGDAIAPLNEIIRRSV